MADYRILGRDTTVRITSGGTLISEITAIKSGTFKPVVTLLSEGFLGEPAKRHREVFDEVQVGISFEPEGKDAFGLQLDVYNRARQGQADPVKINISFRYQFPSGAIVKITVPDVQFDDLGNVDISGREAFVGMTLSGKSDRYILVA